MQKPEVRIINAQSTQINDISVNDYEASALLAKYGYKNNYSSQSTSHGHIEPSVQKDNRSFEEMIRSSEEAERQSRHRQEIEKMRPRAISFDDSRVNFSENKWSSIDLDGSSAGIQVTIVSDMKF